MMAQAAVYGRKKEHDWEKEKRNVFTGQNISWNHVCAV